MSEKVELREVPGQSGKYYVIHTVPGTAVDLSDIVDYEAYEQEIMERLGITDEQARAVGRNAVGGYLDGIDDSEKYEEAFELFLELMDKIETPSVLPECLFCGCPPGYLSDHYPDCVYVRAKKFIEDNK